MCLQFITNRNTTCHHHLQPDPSYPNHPNQTVPVPVQGSFYIVQKRFIHISFYPHYLYTEIHFWTSKFSAVYSCIWLYTAVFFCILQYIVCFYKMSRICSCNQCEYQTTRNKNLNTHKQVRHGGKYSCEQHKYKLKQP